MRSHAKPLGMKISGIVVIVFLFSCIVQYSCNNCNTADCDGAGGIVRLQLMRDGKNILYGPDAIITKDQLVVFSLIPNLYEGYLSFHDSTQTVSFYIEPHAPAVLEINGIRADTFTLTSEVTSMGECCNGYGVTSVSHNGQVICTQTCDEILQVEI